MTLSLSLSHHMLLHINPHTSMDKQLSTRTRTHIRTRTHMYKYLFNCTQPILLTIRHISFRIAKWIWKILFKNNSIKWMTKKNEEWFKLNKLTKVNFIKRQWNNGWRSRLLCWLPGFDSRCWKKQHAIFRRLLLPLGIELLVTEMEPDRLICVILHHHLMPFLGE